jgi:hypothetical protein
VFEALDDDGDSKALFYDRVATGTMKSTELPFRGCKECTLDKGC